jgi:CubicO group peptidase (beta-lactamase class C family)
MQQEIENLAQTVIDGFGVAGMAIGIVKDGQVFAKGFGVKDIETQEPVTARSLFHLASISKTFVATGIVQLAERGRLDLDAPLIAYLPDFLLDDERCREITVRQMLTHTSGMPDTDDYGWDQPEYDDGALERYMDSLAREKLIADPGEQFAYSNIAYEVLGLLIARISGQSFEDYIKQYLLLPLEMNSSTFLKMEVSAEHATAPHIVLPPTTVSPEYPYNRAHAPSSTLHSSAVELCSWALMNLNRGELRSERILKEASFEQLWHPYQQLGPAYPTEFVGLSWFIDSYRGHRTIRHDGVDTGFQSDLILLPEQSLAVIVLANTIPAPVKTVLFAIVDLLLGLEPEFPKPPVLMSLGRILAMQGTQAAVDEYHRLQKTQADQYDFGLEQFLDIVFTLKEVRRYDKGIQVARLGLTLFPDSSELAELLEQIHSKGGETK